MCPIWPNAPAMIHWPLPDPIVSPGTEEDRLRSTIRIAERLQLKLERMVALDWDHHRVDQLRDALEQLADL